MVGGDWEGGEEVREVKEDNPPTLPRPKHHHPKPPATKIGGKKNPKMHFELDDSLDGAPPRLLKKKGPPPPPKPPYPRPQKPPTPQGQTPRTRGGDGADEHIFGTRSTSRTQGAWRWAPRAVSTGGRRGVWVAYPNNPQLYEVARNFPTPTAAYAHLQHFRNPKAQGTPPPRAFGPT